MHALIVGATGATGMDLLHQLLQDPEVRQVSIFVRRPVADQHARLTVHLVDFDRPDDWANLLKGDVLFSCMGTTLKAAGSKAAQWTIDHDYQLNAATAARGNGVKTCVLVSAAGANPRSVVFYSKMKGKLEEAVKALGFISTALFRPPLLVRKDTDRAGEVTWKKVLNFLNGLGVLRSQQPLPTEVLAAAMIRAAKERKKGVAVYTNAAIRRLAEEGQAGL